MFPSAKSDEDNMVAKTLQAHLLNFFKPVLQVRFMGEEVVILKFILLFVCHRTFVTTAYSKNIYKADLLASQAVVFRGLLVYPLLKNAYFRVFLKPQLGRLLIG